MKANQHEPIRGTERWIRPARESGRPATERIGDSPDVDELTDRLLREARKRVSGLAALERELEERIRVRLEETEEEVRRRVAHSEAALVESRHQLDSELEESRRRAEREGRSDGFREGFARGRDEGYRLGFEEGRREGEKEGQREGREEESRRLEGELASAATALSGIALELRERKEELISEARADLVGLALEIAKRIVHREISAVPETVVATAEKAIDLIVRRGALTLEVHPDDVSAMQKALQNEPRWAQGFSTVEIRGVAEVSPGGCRLVAGGGAVDMTIESQLRLIDVALRSAADEPSTAETADPDAQTGRSPESVSDLLTGGDR